LREAVKKGGDLRLAAGQHLLVSLVHPEFHDILEFVHHDVGIDSDRYHCRVRGSGKFIQLGMAFQERLKNGGLIFNGHSFSQGCDRHGRVKIFGLVGG